MIGHNSTLCVVL